ncbi:MAG TPA: hypothetical protein VEH07_10835 [Alphaproteobacteria bacterium]|nr:hypothetical protein [Alphaproteobacteria bacterium]
MPRFRLPLAATALLALVTVAACNYRNPITQPCPTFGILGDAEQATAFIGAGHDLTNVAYRATLSGASLKCDYSSKKRRNTTSRTVDGELSVSLSVERGPALADTQITVPYFVAVTRGKKYVLAREEFSQTFNLAGGTRVGSLEEIPVSIPLAKDLNGDSYEVVVGIELTPDQLAYNRAQRAH